MAAAAKAVQTTESRIMWKPIETAVALVIVGGAVFGQVPQLAQQVQSRFGALSVGDDTVLRFRGRRLQPSIKGGYSLNLGRPFRVGESDVVLVTNNGGTACPYLYYFVTLSESGAQATHSFGTCNAVISVKQQGESITLAMHGYRGPFEPEEERNKAVRETHTFVFHDGVVKETAGL
jgi:hypothetical protein